MTKSRDDYNVYTPELVAELKKLVDGVSRAEGVKILQKRLDISPRNARRQYVKYIKNNPIATTKPSNFTPRKIKRLFIDLETSPNIGFFWKAGFKLNIGSENIIKERAIIMCGYKWETEKEAHVIVWDKDQSDKHLLETLIPLLNEADEVCYHNGDRFDLPWIRTRALYHGLGGIKDIKTVDTLKWARSKFYFNSNKLDYIARYLGIGAKLKTGFDLWKNVVLNKDTKALKAMAEYCQMDVVLLQKVWERLYPLMKPTTHIGILSGSENWTCPLTGSTNVYTIQTRVSAKGVISYQMKCKDTGTYFTISARAHDAYLAAKNL